MDRIAIIGHSRSGNGVAAAAAFNGPPYSPDNAAITFDYNFNIRGVVAVAPTEGAYSPGGRGAQLNDVDYLVLQGAHDGELPSFEGLIQYGRTNISGENFHFKSALYIAGANHGKFNTDWGRAGFGGIFSRPLFNLEQLIPIEDQQQIAKVYISAFLESSLQEVRGYLEILRDYRTAWEWLPETVYINRYDDSHTIIFSNYEEDVNLASTSLSGGRISGEGFSTWKESVIPLKTFNQRTSAVYLAWDNPEASYRLVLPSGVSASPESVLVFAMADAQPPHVDPVDLTIEVVDTGGNRAHLLLSTYSLLQPQIPANRFKSGLVNSQARSEPVPATFQFRMSDFLLANPSFSPQTLNEIRSLFDQTSSGGIYLDDIGLRP